MASSVVFVAASLVFLDRGWAASSSHQQVRFNLGNANSSTHRADVGSSFDYYKYHRFEQISSHLDQLARSHPGIVRVTTIGHSGEGRPLKLVKLGRRDADAVVWIDAGVHAREWIAPATALYVIHRLLERGGPGEGVQWWILPVVNPDGYEFTHTNDRFWRKTRSSRAGTSCRGVDLNRNFDFHFNEVGASDDPCDPTFHGGRPFTEPESVAVRDYIWRHRTDIAVYLSLHSFGSIFVVPWAYTAERSSDWRYLEALAQRANDAQVKAGGRRYGVGSITQFGFRGSGGSDDWAKGVAGIKYSFSIELFGGHHGFLLPPWKIKTVAAPMYEAIKIFGAHAKSLPRRDRRSAS